MAQIKISGYSDDAIEVEGDIRQEFYYNQNKMYLAFSDGTLLSIRYDEDGIWRIAPVIRGLAEYSKDENPATDDDRYSDIVTLSGDIKWVALAPTYAK